MESVTSLRVECGVAALTRPGELSCGDLSVIRSFERGVLVAVLDGIGHGPEAAQAAGIAGQVLRAHPGKPLAALVQECHRELRGTRGVTMSVASFDATRDVVTWLGVGNVQGLLRRNGLNSPAREEFLLLRAGVVGAQLPLLQTAVFPVRAGDTLVFATDGVGDGFMQRPVGHRSPQKAAESILAEFGKSTDDALVLVARYR
jgi:phosphoserine phosphatase RsbX